MNIEEISTPPDCVTWETEEGENGEKVIAFMVDGIEVAAWEYEDKDEVIAEFSRIFNIGVMKGAEMYMGVTGGSVN